MSARADEQRSASINDPRIPSKGERIEIRRNGVSVRGTVCHSDQLQILVKWDNGRSSSLRVGSDRFDIVDRLRKPGDGTESSR
jgi:hypothetical protein